MLPAFVITRYITDRMSNNLVGKVDMLQDIGLLKTVLCIVNQEYCKGQTNITDNKKKECNWYFISNDSFNHDYSLLAYISNQFRDSENMRHDTSRKPDLFIYLFNSSLLWRPTQLYLKGRGERKIETLLFQSTVDIHIQTRTIILVYSRHTLSKQTQNTKNCVGYIALFHENQQQLSQH